MPPGRSPSQVPSPDNLGVDEYAGDAPNPPPDDTAGPSYIGVPSGYRPQGGIGGSIATEAGTVASYVAGRPLYQSGYELEPGRWSPDRIVELQSYLDAAGYMSGNYQPGWWDDNSRSAYRELLGEANARGGTWEQTLALRLQTGAAMGFGGSGAAGTVLPGFTPTLSNPDDLKAIARQVAREVIGKDVSAEDLDRFVTAYQGLERGAQRTEYDLQIGAATTEAPEGGYATGPSGDVVKPPDPQVAAEAAIRYAMPGEAQAHDAAGVYGRLLSLMGMSG